MSSTGNNAGRIFGIIPRVALPAAGLCVMTATALYAANHECHVYGVAEFGGAGDCLDPDDTHSVHEKTAKKFANHFEDLIDDGLWNDVDTRNNGSCGGSYWTDSSKRSGGNDNSNGYGADDADVVFIHTHGSHTTDTRSTIWMGSSSYDCSIRTDDNMLWDADLDIAVIKSCQGGNIDVWESGGYRQQFTVSDSTFRVWNAFHGDSSCGSHVKSYVKSYAKDSDYNGVGENWIDEAYDDDNDANEDDCPISIVVGESGSLRDSMHEYGGWRDRKSTGDKTGSSYYYIDGCDPSNGRRL